MLPTFIIDFDSTFITLEATDELAQIALEHNPSREKIIKEIKNLTKQGMEGKIDFPTSLARRFALFNPTTDDINRCVAFLKEHITLSIRRNKKFFKKYHKQIYIISGGFREYILPIVQEFGIAEDHILANTMRYDARGGIIGFDRANPLARTNGKVKAVMSLRLKDKICVIGDGITDYQIKEQGKADTFFAFTENISRKAVVAKADAVIKSFDEVFFYYNLPRSRRTI